MLLVVFVVAVVYLYRRNKTLEKYAVPILDDHEQVEPRVPDYSDSDDEEQFKAQFTGTRGGGKREMVTMSTRIGNRLSATKNKMKGRNKYQAHNHDESESDDDDDYSDGNNGPSAYLAANQGDDSDSEEE